MPDMEVRRIKDEKEWDTFAKLSPQYTIFSSSQWASIIEKTTSFKTLYYGCFKGQNMLAGLLIYYIKKGPFKIVQYPPLTHYITFLYAPTKTIKLSKIESYEHDIVTLFIEEIKKEFDYFVLSLHESVEDFRPFRSLGLKPKLNYTYILDLKNKDQLWENLDKDTKYSIKKAQEKETVVYQSTDTDKFFELYKKTCKNKNIPVLANKAFLHEILSLKDSVLFFAKNKEGLDIASNIIIFDENKAYYVLAAQDNSYKEYNAPSLLLWEAIQHASKKRGLMDLGGANTYSVAKFKSGFNPKLISYIQTECYTSFLAKILVYIYRLIRK